MSVREHSEEFIRLFLSVERRLYGYIRTMVFNQADAEDLLQEVAVVLWRSFEEFEPGTHFDRWAMRAALNQVRYFRQKHHRNILAFSEPLFEKIAEAAEAVVGQEGDFTTAMTDCMTKLDPSDRDLIQQWSQPRATAASVAKQLGYSRSTISRSVKRIQQMLLRCIHKTLDRTEHHE